MSKLVNVVRSDGTVVAVPEDVALAAAGAQDTNIRLETPGEYQARQDAAAREERNSGFGNALAAGLEGAADTLTFGGYGIANEAFTGTKDILEGNEPGEAMRERAEAHPYARVAGEVAALLVPGDEFSGVGLAKAAGEGATRVAGKAVGRAAEGALLGAGSTIAQANVSNDPLTVEALVEGAGIGGVLGYGQSLLGQSLTSSGARAALKDLELEQEQSDLLQGQKVLSQESPGWGEYKAARDGVTETAEKLNKEIDKEIKAHQEFISGGADFDKTARDFDKALNEMREIVRKDYPGVATSYEERAALDAEAKAANRFVADASKDLQRARTAMRTGDGDTALGILRDLRDRITNPSALSEEASGAQDTGQIVTADYDRTGRLNPRDLRKAGLARERAVQSIDYRQNPPPTPPPELMPNEGWQAMARKELDTAQIRGALGGGPTGKFTPPEVPKFPQLNNPIEAPAGEAPPVREFRNPFETVKLPELPVPPRNPVPVEDIALPKNLADFAKLHVDTVARLANTMSDQESQAVNKLAGELGLTPATTPQETLAAVHRKVRDVVAATEKVGKEKPGLLTLFRRYAKTALKYTVAAKTGGLFPGTITQAAGRAAAGTAIDAVMSQTEEAMLSTSAISARDTLVGRMRRILAKYGTKAGRGLEDLAPVTSYLSRSFPSGEPDTSTTDMRRLAARRVKEIMGAARVAPDTSFAAVQPLIAAPNNLGLAIHQQVVGGVQHLAATAPRDPGLAERMYGDSEWMPSQMEALELAYRMEAAQRPLDAIARQLMGDGHPAATDTLWKVWGGLMGRMQEESALTPKDDSFTSDLAYSGLMGAQVGFSDPRILQRLQGMYLPPPPQGQGQQPTGTPADGGRPPITGRTPAAGSNVSPLISQ